MVGWSSPTAARLPRGEVLSGFTRRLSPAAPAATALSALAALAALAAGPDGSALLCGCTRRTAPPPPAGPTRGRTPVAHARVERSPSPPTGPTPPLTQTYTPPPLPRADARQARASVTFHRRRDRRLTIRRRRRRRCSRRGRAAAPRALAPLARRLPLCISRPHAHTPPQRPRHRVLARPARRPPFAADRSTRQQHARTPRQRQRRGKDAAACLAPPPSRLARTLVARGPAALTGRAPRVPVWRMALRAPAGGRHRRRCLRWASRARPLSHRAELPSRLRLDQRPEEQPPLGPTASRDSVRRGATPPSRPPPVEEWRLAARHTAAGATRRRPRHDSAAARRMGWAGARRQGPPPEPLQARARVEAQEHRVPAQGHRVPATPAQLVPMLPMLPLLAPAYSRALWPSHHRPRRPHLEVPPHPARSASRLPPPPHRPSHPRPGRATASLVAIGEAQRQGPGDQLATLGARGAHPAAPPPSSAWTSAWTSRSSLAPAGAHVALQQRRPASDSPHRAQKPAGPPVASSPPPSSSSESSWRRNSRECSQGRTASGALPSSLYC